MSKRNWKKLSEQNELVVGEVQVEPVQSAKMIAKKDFLISHNGYERHIKSGEDLSDVPNVYFENLRTEKVI